MSDEDIAALVVDNGSGMCKVRMETFCCDRNPGKVEKCWGSLGT